MTSGTWSSGPKFPVVAGDQQDQSDVGGALLPDGNVLLATRTGDVSVNGGVPTHFFLFDGTSLTQAPEYATSTEGGLGYMLLLPTGQVLYNGWPAGLQIFTDPGLPNPAWAPTISSVPPQLAPGKTYTLAGLQLNGLSDGAAFGDDYQPSTDYPLVQITNNGSGAVVFARTSGMTNRSIAPGASSCTDFTLPSGTGTGLSELRVIANGIASAPMPVTIGSAGSSTNSCPSYTLATAKAGSGSGTVTSSQAGIDCGATCSHAYPNGTQIILNAAAASGSQFAGWSGACSGTSTCTVTMSVAKSVTATFNKKPVLKACVVPKVKGKGLKAVKHAIKAHDCSVGKIRHAFSSKVKEGHVISQKPKPHKRLKDGAKVNLVISKGKKP